MRNPYVLLLIPVVYFAAIVALHKLIPVPARSDASMGVNR